MKNDNYFDKSVERLFNELSCYINRDFLASMTKYIMETEEFEKIYNSELYIDRYVNPKFTVERLDYIVPVTIAMIHLFQCTSINNPNEVVKLYNDSEYIEKLKSRVLFQINTKILNNPNEIIHYFSYTPILYFILGISDQFANYYDETKFIFSDKLKKSPNYEFKHDVFFEMTNLTRSICILIQEGNYANVYALMRKLVEMIIIYLYLKDDETAAKEFKNIGETKYKYETDPNFKAQYDSEPNNAGKKSTAYFNYGWMKSLSIYNNSRLNFADLVNNNHLANQDDEDYKMKWYKMYEYCCNFTHTNYYAGQVKVESKHFLIITSTLGELFEFIVAEFSKFVSLTSLTFQDTDLIASLHDVVEETISYRKKLIGN